MALAPPIMHPRADVAIDATPPEERRRSSRTPEVCTAYLVSPTAIDRQGQRIEVQSVNFSRHGIAFESPVPLAERSYYALDVGFGERRLASEVRIVACRGSEGGRFEIGAEFC